MTARLMETWSHAQAIYVSPSEGLTPDSHIKSLARDTMAYNVMYAS